MNIYYYGNILNKIEELKDSLEVFNSEDSFENQQEVLNKIDDIRQLISKADFN
jgi:hypothetical protein